MKYVAPVAELVALEAVSVILASGVDCAGHNTTEEDEM